MWLLELLPLMKPVWSSSIKNGSIFSNRNARILESSFLSKSTKKQSEILASLSDRCNLFIIKEWLYIANKGSINKCSNSYTLHSLQAIHIFRIANFVRLLRLPPLKWGHSRPFFVHQIYQGVFQLPKKKKSFHSSILMRRIFRMI